MLISPWQLLNLARLAWRLGQRPDYLASLARIPAARALARFHPVGRGRGGPITQLSIRITERCNLRCHTCGQWGDQGYLRQAGAGAPGKGELPPGRYAHLLRQLAGRGQRPSVYLWGGEPMLYPGCLEVMEEAARLGMPPSIATNGSGVAQAAQRLVAAPLFLAQISVDGPTAEIHNACRPGANPRADNFQVVCQAMRALSQARRRAGRRLPIIAALCTINHLNHQHLVEHYDFLRQRADLVVYYLSWWIDQPRALEHERDFQARFGFAPQKHRGWIGAWRPGDLPGLWRQLRQVASRAARPGNPPVFMVPNPRGLGQLQSYYHEHRALLGPRRCPAIYNAVEVNANGEVSPCRDYSDYVVGNLGEASILELWNNAAFRRFRQSLGEQGLMPVCTRCCGRQGY